LIQAQTIRRRLRRKERYSLTPEGERAKKITVQSRGRVYAKSWPDKLGFGRDKLM